MKIILKENELRNIIYKVINESRNQNDTSRMFNELVKEGNKAFKTLGLNTTYNKMQDDRSYNEVASEICNNPQADANVELKKIALATTVLGYIRSFTLKGGEATNNIDYLTDLYVKVFEIANDYKPSEGKLTSFIQPYLKEVGRNTAKMESFLNLPPKIRNLVRDIKTLQKQWVLNNGCEMRECDILGAIRDLENSRKNQTYSLNDDVLASDISTALDYINGGVNIEGLTRPDAEDDEDLERPFVGDNGEKMGSEFKNGMEWFEAMCDKAGLTDIEKRVFLSQHDLGNNEYYDKDTIIKDGYSENEIKSINDKAIRKLGKVATKSDKEQLIGLIGEAKKKKALKKLISEAVKSVILK